MNLKSLTDALPSNYSAQFKPADDEAMDAEIAILLHDVETAWTIQCGHGYFCVNQNGYENGEFAWMDHHGEFRSLKAAAAKLSKLLA